MNQTLPPQTARCTCPKCGFSSEQNFAFCPNCGTSTTAPPPSSPSIWKLLMQGFLGLAALSMTGFSLVMSFIILVSGGGSKPEEWVLQIGLFPNLISAVCIGGIIFLGRVMR